MKIYIAATPPEAHIVCELLKSRDIRAEVRGEGLFGLQGELPFGEDSEPYVWLFDTERELAAQSIINEFQAKQTTAAPDWRCRQCNEWIEAQFSICWNCGQALE
ncbi:DUF2007 domain-containing protein [Vibrio sp. SCSIO 43136]|uniref:DUF2007 domain-containing protein n=1 Tax=Vibrio sp. SCSIO 43136 TaxID=2819101 RepID=UPI002075E82E|nr:DUF2007 domain-containing protein [Vibrio sp. SCSIO 43136]USD66263.1 DUF2007 domain-containing protein [Vibrio sp. SCSIO 43136]